MLIKGEMGSTSVKKGSIGGPPPLSHPTQEFWAEETSVVNKHIYYIGLKEYCPELLKALDVFNMYIYIYICEL